jgi:asparagine synthase (glutamine-hydrolysing)
VCGIAVAIDWSDPESAVARLMEGLLHRGDVSDPIVRPRAGIAMATRRLRIVDQDHGAQPVLSADGRILVSFNGEIYNHADLRREMEALGVRFRTRCDTEALANALSLWGPKALHRINGMYAFVAVDTANGEFLAARDPFGVKPLYVIQSGAGFLFSSEMRPLLSTVETGDVWVVPPGHFMTRNHVGPFSIWPTDCRSAMPDRSAKALDRLVRSAVHSRIPPDLPFALLFSGGIDSTLVAHYAREIRPEAPGYFLGDDDAPDYPYAARYADQSGLELRRVPLGDLSKKDVSRLEEVVATTEAFEPAIIRDALCNYALFERIHADGFRVALSGEGADELFAGYLPLKLAFADSDAAGNFVRDQCLGIMGRTNLQRVDRCGMHFQVEAREPLLDPGLATFAKGASSVELVDGSGESPVGKLPLRGLWELYRDRLPREIGERRKIAMQVGSGLDASQKASPWIDYAERTIGDAEFQDGKREFAAFKLSTKEEYAYLRILSRTFDVSRVPQLAQRPFLRFPALRNSSRAAGKLADFLVEA